MRRLSATLVSLLALACLAASGDASALSPEQLRPLNLRVFGGEANWHPTNDFQLDWDLPPLPSGSSVTAVDYRIGAPASLAPVTTLPWMVSHLEHLHVPAQPGLYTAEVRLAVDGQYGPWGAAALRFDDARPGAVQPQPAREWFAGDEAALVKVGPAASPAPVSGVRGYAVSIDRGDGSWPCASRSRCSVAETDLAGGGDDTIALRGLPEGLSVVRAVAVSAAGVPSAEAGSAIVRVDATRPEVALAGNPAGWSSAPVRLTALARDAMSGMVAAGPGGPATAIAVDGGVPRTERGERASVLVSGEGVHQILFYARDAAGNSGEEAPARASVQIDESAPTVAFARAQDPAEPERIEATVADRLSGADPGRGSIGVRRAGSRQRFEPLPTTIAGDRLVAHWDSDSYPRGTYEFQATGYDRAGNVMGSDRRAGGARMVLANPLKTTSLVVAGFGGRELVWQRCVRGARQRHCRREAIRSFEERPTVRAVPFGRTVAYGGRLTTAGGAPLGRLPLEVVETFAPGSETRERRTTVQTAADGSFAARLGPGPSRWVEVVFAGTRTLGRASGGGVELEVLSGVRLHASTAAARVGGAPVVFSGQLQALDAPIPLAGRPLELQFRVPGGEWSEFRTVRTDARGRFRYDYSFSDDDSRGIRFQFRAVAPAADDWPYQPAASRPVFVTGR